MKRFVCIDVEMSELTSDQKRMIGGSLRNEVIQIGAVMLDENYNMISEFSSYVKPRYSIVTPFIQNLTGITNATLENTDDFITVLDKYNYWLGDNDVTSFCWSTSDYNQLWDEMSVKAKQRTDLFASLKKFVDLQNIYCVEIGAEVPISLESALRLLQLDYQGQIHSANWDAFNTARILHKIFCTKSLAPSIEYIDFGKPSRLKNETKLVLDKVRVKENDNKCSLASYLSPELLAQFGFIQQEEVENADADDTVKKVDADPILITSPLTYLTKDLFLSDLCEKYRVLKSKWIRFLAAVMPTSEMSVA